MSEQTAQSFHSNYQTGQIMWKQDTTCFKTVSISYDEGNFPFVGYQWYNSTGIINGETSKTINVSSNESYYLIARDEYNNYITSNTVVIDLCPQPTAKSLIIKNDINKLEEKYILENNLEFNLYPNPNNGEFIIAYNRDEAISVEIFDLLGNLVYTKLVLNMESISLKNESKGIYMIKAKYEDEVLIKKVIIK